MEAFICDSCRESFFYHVEDFIKLKLDAQVPLVAHNQEFILNRLRLSSMTNF